MNATPKPRSRLLHRLRQALPYAGALLLVTLILAGLWPRPTPVETAHVTLGALRSSVDEEGRTRVRHRYVVSAPVTGQLRRIDLQAGTEVQARHTVVAIIDPVAPALLDARTRVLAEARRDAASAQVDKARAASEFAASELRRFTRLRKEGSVSAQELEAAQLRDTAAVRDLAAAESALRQAEAEMAEFKSLPGAEPARPPVEVHAPADGRILRVLEESARVVLAGTPLVEIGNPGDLEVVIEVLSRDGAAITAGTPVELEHWGGPRPLQARVRLVEPAAFTKVSALGVEEQRVRVIADLLTPPDQRPTLGDQFRVEARILTWQDDRALQVPSGALFRHGQGWATFVMENLRARQRSVQIGHASRTHTQIVSGLQEDEAVILYPGDRVRDGARVRPLQLSR
jgi:HlyD family secretion protein